MLIQVDVDSTLYDADKLFSKLANEAGVKWPDRANCWKPAHELEMHDGSACSVDILKKVFRKCHSREYVMEQKPYPHAVKVLKGWADDFEDVEIAYVSDRNEQQGETLKEWLQATGFLSDENQKVAATKDKRHWMREHRPEIVIDDRVRTMLMARYELGSKVVSLVHNHNINLRGEADGIYICKDWKEIDRVVRELKASYAPVSHAKELSKV